MRRVGLSVSITPPRRPVTRGAGIAGIVQTCCRNPDMAVFAGRLRAAVQFSVATMKKGTDFRGSHDLDATPLPPAWSGSENHQDRRLTTVCALPFSLNITVYSERSRRVKHRPRFLRQD